jgi:hypothetical protein
MLVGQVILFLKVKYVPISLIAGNECFWNDSDAAISMDKNILEAQSEEFLLLLLEKLYVLRQHVDQVPEVRLLKVSSILLMFSQALRHSLQVCFKVQFNVAAG